MTEIRRAGEGDLGGLLALAEAGLDDPWSEAAFEQELRHPGARVYLAEEAGRGVGYLAVRRVLDEVHIHGIAVRGPERRRGIARALVEHAHADQPPARTWLLEVREDNGGARACYERLGFVEVGRRPGYYRDGAAAVLMTRNLAGSGA